jgi:hypothetical protein
MVHIGYAMCMRAFRTISRLRHVHCPLTADMFPRADSQKHVEHMLKTAIISDCGLYRYELRRIWDQSLPRVQQCAIGREGRGTSQIYRHRRAKSQ